MTEQTIQDAILRSALELQRVAAGEQDKADLALRQLAEELRALLNSRDLSAAGKREVAALLEDAEQAIRASYKGLYGMFDPDGVAVHIAERTVEALRSGVIGAAISLPTPETLASLSREVLIEGSPLKDWWARQADDTAFRFAAAVRQGVANGETQERIVARVIGRTGEPGVLDVSRRQVRALVHSSVMSAANEARMAVYRKNSRFMAGVRWLSTLDSHTCKTCAALDGQAWDFDGKPLKGTSMRLRFPPAHANCRCVVSPVPKSLDQAFGQTGLDAMRDSLSQRASSQGPIGGSTNFADFLKRQTPEFVERVLGKRRAELYLAGKITLRDLVSGEGRPLTLDEIRAN